MEKNITLKVEGLDVVGQLKYGDDNKSEIFLTLPKNKSHYFKKLFDYPEAFNINGKFEDDCEFTAFSCHIVALHTLTNDAPAETLKAIIDFSSNEESDILIKYRIEIGTLFIGASNIDKTIEDIKKSEFKISHQIFFLEKSKKVYISKYDCYITFNKSITIEFQESVSLEKLNKVIFDLKILLQLFILDNDIEIIEKYFYKEDNTKVEEIKKYKLEDSKQSEIKYMIEEREKFDIERTLNLWFEAKEKYGKIFDYLSGILQETTLKHIEFKLFALAQWIEAYSRILFETKKMEKDIEKNKNQLKQKIKDSILLSENEKNDFREYCNYDIKGHTFYKKLEDLFKKNNLFEDLFNSNVDLLKDIVCYRNNLTHLNIEDNLNNEQAINLYEILKNLIYMFIMKELQIEDNNKYEDFKKEVKHSYSKYDALSKTLKSVETIKLL